MKPFRALVFLTAYLAVACTASAQTKLSIGYSPAAAFLPIFVAKERGIFEKLNLDVTLQMVPVTPNLVGGVMSGSLTFGTLTPSMMIKAVEGGAPLTIVAGGTIYDNISGGVVARPDANIRTAADFSGKKIAIPGINSIMQVLFIQWLKVRGVEADAVEFVEVGFSQMGDLLKGRQIDAAIVTEPFLSRIRESGTGLFVANYASEVKQSFLETFYASKSDWAKQNPQAIFNFREALHQSLAYIRENPAEAVKIQAKYLKLPEAVIAKIPTPAFSTVVTPDQIQYWTDLMVQLRLINGTLSPGSLITQ